MVELPPNTLYTLNLNSMQISSAEICSHFSLIPPLPSKSSQNSPFHLKEKIMSKLNFLFFQSVKRILGNFSGCTKYSMNKEEVFDKNSKEIIERNEERATIGIMFSGGLDSALIALVASIILPSEIR